MTTPFVLDATTKSIQAVMSGAPATTNPSVTAAWADDTGSAFTEGASDTALNGTTPVTLIAAPASSTRRVVKSITIANIDTAPVTITLSYNDNSTLRTVVKVTLAVNDTWTTDGTYDSAGNLKTTNSTGTVTLTVGSSLISSGTTTRILYDNAGVLGEYTLTGSGTVVMMQTAPTFVTSMTGPLLIGGSGTTGTQLTLKTTTGNGTTDALVILGGNNGGTTFATFSANVLNLGTSAVLTTGTIELGAATDTTISRVSAGVIAVEGVTVPTISSTNTLTNKRITRRLTTVNAPGATPTTNSDNDDIANFTGLGTAITSMTTNLSGTPVDGDLLEFRFTDDGTARAITWGGSFAATTVALPTTTVISTMLRVLFEWDGAIWRCVAVA